MDIGSIWFSPKAFFPAWWKAIGKTDSDIPGMAGSGEMVKTFGLTILASVVVPVFMVMMVAAMGKVTPGGATALSSALTGLALWVGFVAPSSLTNRVFAGQLKAWVLEIGFHLVTFILFGAILGAWHLPGQV